MHRAEFQSARGGCLFERLNAFDSKHQFHRCATLLSFTRLMESNQTAAGGAFEFQPTWLFGLNTPHPEKHFIERGDFLNVFHVQDYAADGRTKPEPLPPPYGR